MLTRSAKKKKKILSSTRFVYLGFNAENLSMLVRYSDEKEKEREEDRGMQRIRFRWFLISNRESIRTNAACDCADSRVTNDDTTL